MNGLAKDPWVRTVVTVVYDGVYVARREYIDGSHLYSVYSENLPEEDARHRLLAGDGYLRVSDELAELMNMSQEEFEKRAEEQSRPRTPRPVIEE